MSQENLSPSTAASPEMQTTFDSDFGTEYVPAQGVFDLPVNPGSLKDSPLTRSKVESLQRIIGNQATQRVIQRELANRKSKSLVQRVDISDTKEGAAAKEGAARGKAFWNSQQERNELAKENTITNVKTIDFTRLTLEEFKRKKILQETVFKLAGEAVENKKSEINAILATNKIEGAEVSVKKKRDNFDDFVEGVIKKCSEKPYKYIGEMDDIARGRVNLNVKGDMEKIVKGLKPITKEITAPRKNKEGVEYYPRYHVITFDKTGLTFEWQLGTKATTFAYEKKGIEIPPALQAAAGKQNFEKSDLHDIDYAVFGKMVASNDPAITKVAQDFKLDLYHKKVALLLQESGNIGETNPEFEDKVNGMLTEASKILGDMVAGGHTKLIISFLH